MNRSRFNLAGAVAILGMSLGMSQAWAGATQTGFSVPLANINNPCTSGHDGINGSLDINAVAQHSNGVHFVRISGHGSGADAHGLRYQFSGMHKLQLHDPFPAWCYLRLKMISKGSTDNASLVVAVHLNGQGEITKAEFSGVECKG